MKKIFYIFEDFKDDRISCLFRSRYPCSVTNHFIYAAGAGNLSTVLDRYAQQFSHSGFIIYCDLIPDNPQTKTCYERLWRLVSRRADLHQRVLVVPVVCAEYAYLDSFDDAYPILDTYKDSIKLCLSRKPYYEDNLINNPKCKSYEKFCKILCMCGIDHCGSTAARREDALYFQDDCPTTSKQCFSCDVVKPLAEKSHKFNGQYLFLDDTKYNQFSGFDKYTDTIIDLLKVYNARVDEYKESYTNIANKTFRREFKKFDIKLMEGLINAAFEY